MEATFNEDDGKVDQEWAIEENWSETGAFVKKGPRSIVISALFSEAGIGLESRTVKDVMDRHLKAQDASDEARSLGSRSRAHSADSQGSVKTPAVKQPRQHETPDKIKGLAGPPVGNGLQIMS